MPNARTLALEKRLALAHRVLWQSAQLAETKPDLGLHDDLMMLCVELERIQQELLKTRPYRRASPSKRA